MKILLLAALCLLPLQTSRPAAKPTSQPAAAVQELSAKEREAIVREQLPSYPLQTCSVSGEPLGSMGDAINHIVDGRLVRLCCKGCLKGVEKDKAGTIAKIDDAVRRAQGPSYPLEVCVVSGEPLAPNSIHNEVVGTRLLRTCCKKCGKTVAKNPRPYLEKVNAALIEAQKKSYKLTTCLISGEALGSEPVDYLYGTQLVRMCCNSCVRVFEKNPSLFLADLPAEQREATAPQKK